jgi:hypothetical protein
VTHRLDVHKGDRSVVLEFQGLLDAAALAALRAAVVQGRAGGGAVRIELRPGTEIERSCLSALRTIDAEVVADSAYLARWIDEDASR